MAKTKKGFVVIRDDDSEDDIAIPQSRTVRLSNHGRNLIQTARSPQKGAASSNRFSSPVYEWNASNDYDTIDLLPGDETEEGLGWEAEDLPVAAKVAAKRYPTSVSVVDFTRSCYSDSLQDDPLREWAGQSKSDLGYREEYLLEMLRLEGRGDVSAEMECMSCASTNPGVYRCEDCLGRLLECSTCCVFCHRLLPLHIIQVSIHPFSLSVAELRIEVERDVFREDIFKGHGPSCSGWPPQFNLC